MKGLKALFPRRHVDVRGATFFQLDFRDTHWSFPIEDGVDFARIIPHVVYALTSSTIPQGRFDCTFRIRDAAGNSIAKSMWAGHVEVA